MNFGKNIKKIRAIKKLSQARFAELFDLTRSSVSAYEEERAEPKLDVIIKIAEYFNLTVDKLVNSEITVNEFYRFNKFMDDFASGNINIANPLQHLVFAKIPIISSLDVWSNPLSKLRISEFIILPNLGDDHLAILVHENNFTDIALAVRTNDILIVNKKYQHEPGMQFKGKLWLVKMNHALYLGEIEQLPTGEAVFFSEKQPAFVINVKAADFILPVITLITANYYKSEEKERQMKKMAYKIDDIYKKLTQ